MNFKLIGSNQARLETNHGDTILYSYDIPVAGYVPAIGYFRVNQNISIATTQHINKYLSTAEDVLVLTPQQIEELFK